MIPEAEIRRIVRQVVEQSLGAATPPPPTPAPAQAASTPPPRAAPRRRIIGETDVMAAQAGGTLTIPAGAIITPLARDLARQRRIRFVTEPGSASNSTTPWRGQIIALGADHAGLELKEVLKKYLAELGCVVKDCGTFTTQAVDYPDFAYAVAKLVADGSAARGIVVDGAGIGSCMVANKVPGIRAALCYDKATAVNSREHNDANVLTLGGRMIQPDAAKEIVKIWLATPFGGGRHARRVEKMMQVESRFLRK